MTDSHKKRINDCYQALVDNMEVEDLVNHLRSAHLLTKRYTDTINQFRGKSAKAESLLNIILRRPDVAFGKLVEALQSTSQSHLATLLLRKSRFSVDLVLDI